MNTHTLPIIGYHHSPLTQKFGIPRQPNLVAIKSHIRFVAPFDTPDAFVGIERYSHLWVLWQFHHNKIQTNFRPQVRPPRLGGNDKIGVFATRSMYRPSQLGLSVVALDKVEMVDNQTILHIKGADMADGTPIFDIKPYLPYADSVRGAVGVDTPMAKTVLMSKQAQDEFDSLVCAGVLQSTDEQVIVDLVAQDPRPAYRQAETDSVFAMRYGAVDVDFYMNGQGVLVLCGVRLV
ncbi:MAG: tRNA (N6-threonylcarbamoyladenosine(37)-N6)-methyltransferase TrmO [Moraxella sp.]|nr:tRNA (N6-threonylcarbamoyladenosine(37)-N6)-methyltransferase TrmO [Moraxella sp.]